MLFRRLRAPRRQPNVRLWVTPLEKRLTPTTYTVNTTADSGTGSLRQAIINANGNTGADSIVFDAAVFASATTITMALGQMSISDPVTITGPTAKLTINANATSRHFSLGVGAITGAAINISNLTLINGNGSGGSGGSINNVDEALTLTNCTLANNTVSGDGGAIYQQQTGTTLTINDCVLSNNTGTGAASDGGAIFLVGGTNVSVSRSTISGNTVGRSGGAIYFLSSLGSVTLVDSTVSGNRANVLSTAYGGGAMYFFGQTVTVRNSTISGNSAHRGGGIRAGNATQLTVQNSTLAFNTATTYGGGISNGGSTVTITSTIVGKNSAPTSGPDFSGSVSANFSLIANTSGATISDANNKTNQDPLLIALANNGGPTMTHALSAGSPAANNGSNTAGLSFDQRGTGYPRVIGAAADIGAFEMGTTVIPFATAATTNVSAAGGTSHTIAVTYIDEAAINVASLTTGDITVTGPGGFSATATFNSVNNNTNGTPRIATYSFTPPGGSWDAGDNGSYTITVNAGQVFDADTPTANAVPAGAIGSFNVGVVTNYVVDLATDENDGNYAAGDLSLREALTLANASTGTFDTISFSPSVFAGATTMSWTLGQMAIADKVTINGPAAPLVLDANNASRFFSIDVPGLVLQQISISNLTLHRGQHNNNAGSIEMVGEKLLLTNVTISNSRALFSGGAIRMDEGEIDLEGCTFTNNGVTSGQGVGGALQLDNPASLIVRNCVFNGNFTLDNGSTPVGGGAIWVYGTGSVMTSLIEDSSFINNTATGRTGAVSLAISAGMTIRRCTFSGNSAAAGGGALGFGAPVTGTALIEACTFSNNTAGGEGGGAVYVMGGNPIFRNSTLVDNVATGPGGAIGSLPFMSGLTLQNCTITGNTSASSGGAIAVNTGSSASVTLESSVLSENFASDGSEVSSPGTVSAKNCALANTTGITNYSNLGGNLIGVNVLLGPLTNNGGTTLTRMPLDGSPLLNVGSNPAGLTSDQRGSVRVIGSAIDIGAVEKPLTPAKIQSVVINNGDVQRSRVTQLRITFDSVVAMPPAPYSPFVLARQTDGMAVTLALSVTNTTTTSVDITFTNGPVEFGSLADGRYTLTAMANLIPGFDGNGDGVAGDDFVLVGTTANKLFRIFGDADGNGINNLSDFAAFRSAFNLGPNVAFDFDNDGNVGLSDFAAYRARFNLTA